MNRDELAALIAQTHSISHSSAQPSSTSRERLQHPLGTPTSPPLSPRQIFQSRVRTLSDDGDPDSNRSPSPKGHGQQLQHLSSLRVHVRTDYLRRPIGAQSTHHDQSKDGRFGFSSAEPDFVAEERAAWTRGLPHEQFKHDSAQIPVGGSIHRGNFPFLELEDDQVEQPASTLKPFGQASGPIDVDDRPKTSRGPGSESETTLPGIFSQDSAQPNYQGLRRSKFLEGSMTDRSVAVASTWNELGFRISESSDRSEETDSDATPRASRASRNSGSSFDVSEFRPPPTTPSTIKGKLTKLVKRASEDQAKPREDEKKPKKKGLRKSMSTWSFHNISDKMKFFGASSSDLPENQDSSVKKDQNAEMAELKERKRRAEEAHAQQFGTKKQKSNDGIPTQNTKPQPTPSQPRTLKKRSVSPRTITRATATRRLREASDSTTRSIRNPVDMAAISGSDHDHDHRKRPSRSELEKENHQLRTMLREQQAQQAGYFHLSASKSSVHLPLADDTHVPNFPISTRSPADSSSSSTSSNPKTRQQQKKHHNAKRGGSVPPVPPLPSRAILANLANLSNAPSTLQTQAP